LSGVALHVANVVERDAEPLVHELGEHGGVSLAVGMRPAEDGERPAGIEAQLHALVEDAAELDVVAHRAAAQLAVLLRGLLSRRKAVPITELDALVHLPLEFAAVVIPQRRCRIGKFARRNEVAAPDLGGIHADDPRRVLDEPLNEISRLGPSGTAIRTG